MGKLKIDYVKITWQYNKDSKIEVEQYSLAVYSVLEITFLNPYITSEGQNDAGWKKEFKKLRRRIGKYDLKQSVISMDKGMEKVMGKEDMAYSSRKKELFDHRYEICKLLKTGREDERSGILIVLEQEMLSFHELKLLMLTVKDVFEDITIFSGEIEAFDRLCTYLREEWGVCVMMTEDAGKLRNVYDATLFLITDWRPEYSQMCSGNIYLLSKEEMSGEFLQTNSSGVRMFSGMKYVCEKKVIPYQMAVDLLYQKEEGVVKCKPVAVGFCEPKGGLSFYKR